MADVNTTVDAPHVYVCACCGKRSRSRSGFDRDGKRASIDDGWDSSCCSWSALCVPDGLDERGRGKWMAVEGE